ncbi:putative Endoplasmic reticulum-Golgi intermediate compartment protein, partial [Naja naja]
SLRGGTLHVRAGKRRPHWPGLADVAAFHSTRRFGSEALRLDARPDPKLPPPLPPLLPVLLLLRRCGGEESLSKTRSDSSSFGNPEETENQVYRDTWMKYEYEVDKDYTSKLRMNIDITVAMKYIGADVLDLAETMVATADGLVYEPVIFELSPMQREWQRILQNIQARLQEEHSLQDIIFKSAFKSASTALPPREDNPVHSADACRIHGHLYVNKGDSPPEGPRTFGSPAYNFSHRIDHLSFGELIPGIINPLDGTEKIATDHNQMFQYFVTERVINHAAGSHGVSGIFMKYDISSLMVTVTEEHMPFWQFIVQLPDSQRNDHEPLVTEEATQ